MITIFGALGLAESDRSYVSVVGQSVVYDAVAQVLGDHNDDVEDMSRFFIERSTSDFSLKYKLPGGGRLQRRGRQSDMAEVKAAGDWTVQLPLEDFGAAFGTDDVTLAYMTLPELDNHLRTIQIQDLNTFRYEILRALFNRTSRPFKDERAGNLTIQPLANNDASIYPPISGSEDNTTANHYLGVAVDTRTFNDATNPIPQLVSKLEDRFGAPTGGASIVILINPAQTASVENLAAFTPVGNRFVAYGDNVSLVMQQLFPEGMPPGRVLGEVNGALIVEWRWIPAGYMAGFHLEAPKPLIKRIDLEETGLTPGLQLISFSDTAPLIKATYRNRYGLGVGNRLNGVIIDLTAVAANAYTTPPIYA